MSNNARGNRYRKKTKDWLEAQGYQVEYTEKYISHFIPGKGMFHSKKDIFGSDGVAISKKEIIFWNSKGTEDLKKRKNELIKTATDAFAKFNFPDSVKRLVVIWELRAKNPVVIQCL